MITPATSKQIPWQIAQARHAFVFWSTLPLQVSAWYWQTWADVYAPGGRK